MAFTRPNNNKSIWRSKPDILQEESASVKADLDRLINENADDTLTLIGELEGEEGAGNIGTTGGATVQDHIADTENPHAVTAAQVGLGSCDNTADLQKPLSAAAQAALEGKVDKAAGLALSANNYDNTEKAAVAANTAARHTHGNRALLDTYTQTEAALAGTVAQSHGHANKALIDTLAASDLTKWNTVTDKANTADVLTKTNAAAFTPTADYHPATKKYADEIAAAAGSVVSVFGRAGAVTAQAGDYTAAQVGAETPAGAQARAEAAGEEAYNDAMNSLGMHANGTGSGAAYGHVKLSDSTSSTSGTSGGIAATPAAVKAAYDKAAAAYCLTNKPYISGVYTGNGEADRFILLPFTPSAVLILVNGLQIANYPTNYGGLSVTNYDAAGNALPSVHITGFGFRVYYNMTPEYNKQASNYTSSVYHYIAFI